MQPPLRIDTPDGSFDAYVARPARTVLPSTVVVLHDVFGIDRAGTPVRQREVGRARGDVWKGITESTAGPAGEAPDVSNRPPSRLPDASSSVPRTTSRYSPGCQGRAGVNVQVLSPFASRARPATRWPRASAIAR
jgi:hypothetical protein